MWQSEIPTTDELIKAYFELRVSSAAEMQLANDILSIEVEEAHSKNDEFGFSTTLLYGGNEYALWIWINKTPQGVEVLIPSFHSGYAIKNNVTFVMRKNRYSSK